MFSDWIAYFWPQILHPNTVQPLIFNLPWLFVVAQPLRLIGIFPSLVIIQIFSLFVILKLAKALELSKWRTALVFLSAPVVWNVFMGQIDGLLLAAYLALPPLLSGLLALCKPQTNLAAGWDAFKKKPLLVGAVCAVALISAYLIWRWPFSTTNPQTITNLAIPFVPPLLLKGWNWSLWPWGLLLIPLVIKDPKVSGLFASPFIFPYSGLQSLIGPIMVAAKILPTWAYLLMWASLWFRWAWMLKLF